MVLNNIVTAVVALLAFATMVVGNPLGMAVLFIVLVVQPYGAYVALPLAVLADAMYGGYTASVPPIYYTALILLLIVAKYRIERTMLV